MSGQEATGPALAQMVLDRARTGRNRDESALFSPRQGAYGLCQAPWPGSKGAGDDELRACCPRRATAARVVVAKAPGGALVDPLGRRLRGNDRSPLARRRSGDSTTVSDVVYRLTGGSFIAAGLVAWQRRPAERVGALMVATGFLFFVAPLAAQVDSSIVQTVGLLGTDYWTIAFVVLLLVFPQSRVIRGRLEGALVVAFAIPLLVAQPLWLLFLDDPDVVNDLGFFPNERAADWIDKGQRGLLLAATFSLFLVLVWRWWHASPPLRRVLLPVLAGGATMLSFGALLALDLINGTRSQTQLTVTVVVLATVPVAFVVGLLRSRLARVAVGDLVLDAAVGAGSCRAPCGDRTRPPRSVGDTRLLAAGVRDVRRPRRAARQPAGRRRTAGDDADRPRGPSCRCVGARPVVAGRAGAARRGDGRGRNRDRERAAPRRAARAPGGGPRVAGARDRGGPEGAQAAGARPARRRPAAAGRARAQPEAARAPPRPIRRRGRSWTTRSARSTSRSPSCATSRAGSIRPSSPGTGSRSRSSRWPPARRCPSGSRSTSAAGCRSRSRWPRTTSSPRA